MTDTIIGAFIGVGGAIIGAAIAGIISYCVTVNLIRRQEFYRAAAGFRATFTNELRYLQSLVTYNETTSGETILKLLESADIKFNNACIRFRHHLTEPEQISFDNAWREYCHPQGGDPKQIAGAYYEYFGDNVSVHDSINLIIEKIEKLLAFAKTK